MVLFKLVDNFAGGGGASTFTFHYGPIQITSFSGKAITMYKFTFHYGPIQILKQQLNLLQIKYLHSTMVLFKLS